MAHGHDTPSTGHPPGSDTQILPTTAVETTTPYPAATSPTLHLTPATTAEKQRIWHANATEWKGALTTTAYLRREAHLSAQDLTANGGITIWILIDSSHPHRRILASCESYRKKALVARDGIVRDVVAHGIGSVFCPRECRGRGYGKRMMQELGVRLRTWQAGNEKGVDEAAFSILYSDIGTTFYRKLGWVPFQSKHVCLPVACAGVPAYASLDLPVARPLYAGDLAELCAADERVMRGSLQEVGVEGKTAVALVPDVATVRWHHAREEFVARELFGRVPDVKGAVVGTKVGGRVWCYFTRMFYNKDPGQRSGNTLHVLRIVVEGKREDVARYLVPAIAALFKLALEEAGRWNVEGVEAWNPGEDTVEAARILCPDAKVVQRDEESIPSLMWYGTRRRTGDIGEEVEWLGNEKYAWC